ncbi:deoxyribonuclease IV [Dethiobacter alkaliphilus]|uniref:Probable endonuclease 4 n=1 Tax=Dethiobacter alkaliphilus AHT 1 TaxID=555088 RepID=C0GKM0_DETAL|nr:deoxyribonuclease IV [Dethiobacter alkaliphilus]EEG76112.1 apurinic endonuclease Apn1 [Dethiobacter alkaliphilus AHT 1]
MRLGSHLSVSKGFHKAAEAAASIGANTFQFFTRNPRGGSARTISPQEVEKWQEARKKYDIYPIMGHLPYTVNMASPAERAYNFAKMVVADDLERMDAVGAEYLVIHPGSHAGSGREAGLERIVACLEESFLPYDGETSLLLETMAGQGSEIGTLADIAEIMEKLSWPDGMGVCLDSCHLTGAGYDFLQKEEVDRLVTDVKKTVGLSRVRAMHLNDSKFPPGTHKDRHERIGAGYLGKEGLLNLITHPAFKDLPMALETPVEDFQQYGEEITLIRSWL